MTRFMSIMENSCINCCQSAITSSMNYSFNGFTINSFISTRNRTSDSLLNTFLNQKYSTITHKLCLHSLVTLIYIERICDDMNGHNI